METVRDTDVVFETVVESGMRATIGKCMMDSDAQVPPRLREDTQASLDESVAIRKRWDGAANGRRLQANIKTDVWGKRGASPGAAFRDNEAHNSESRDGTAGARSPHDQSNAPRLDR